MNSPLSRRSRLAGFTLIELLAVIAVIGILAAILVPSVGLVQQSARRSAAQSQLREIQTAYMAYTEGGSRARAINADSIYEWARILAQYSEFNDAKMWLVSEDPLVEIEENLPLVVATPPSSGSGPWQVHPDFQGFPLSFAVANRLSSQAPSSTPLAWTRGLTTAGTWADESAQIPGVYGDKGGHVAFLNGAVDFYEDLSADGGLLIDYDSKQPTGNISEALSPNAQGLDFTGSAF
jgi:prepilin-type N-terminal cleavage/methylation domain-containing protein